MIEGTAYSVVFGIPMLWLAARESSGGIGIGI